MRSRLLAAVLLASAALAQTHHPEAHHEAVNKRGDHVMGFSHEKTTHHFRLLADGGAIEVTANDAKDTASRDQIRSPLTHIAQMFGEGNFRAPMLIHDQVPPGVPVLKERKDKVSYRYEEITNGARIKITTADIQALSATHDFLKFQIEDHKTGDPTTP